ncbi:hypothetical protein [Hominenteromicrobium sp.]
MSSSIRRETPRRTSKRRTGNAPEKRQIKRGGKLAVFRPFLRVGAAAVFAYRTACIRRETGAPHGLRGMETQVYVREPDGWKLAHVHYSCEAVPR